MTAWDDPSADTITDKDTRFAIAIDQRDAAVRRAEAAAARAEAAEARLAQVEALHRGTHQCVDGTYYTTDPNYRGSVAQRGPCPTLAALAPAPTGEDERPTDVRAHGRGPWWLDAVPQGAPEATGSVASLPVKLNELARRWEQDTCDVECSHDRCVTVHEIVADLDALVPEPPATLPLHRTEAGWPRCSTCDGSGCPDCTDPA